MGRVEDKGALVSARPSLGPGPPCQGAPHEPAGAPLPRCPMDPLALPWGLSLGRG